jgi:hypothetical protein
MARLSQFLALFLLALWLPATQHCALEAAEVLTDSCTAPCANGTDNCGTIEDGAYKPSTTVMTAPAPALVADVSHLGQALVLPAAASAPAFLAGAPASRAPDWVLTWQFVRRAAPSPRAPSLLSA